MASNVTQHYQLCQWEPGDKVERLDFNSDNAKLDAAIKAAADVAEEGRALGQAAYSPENRPLVVGTYVGTSELNLNYGQLSSQKITLGFRPSMVLVWNPSVYTYNTSEGMASGIGMAIYGVPLARQMLVLEEDGFSVGLYMDSSIAKPRLNVKGVTYSYIAFR